MATSKLNIPIGARYGSLVVTGLEGRRSGKLAVTCLCDCGAATTVSRSNLHGGKVSSCGCSYIKYKTSPGQRFGYLTVIDGTVKRRGTVRVVTCSCECGSIVEPAIRTLFSGEKVSCGCRAKKREVIVVKHGHARRGAHSPEYEVWCSMIARCENPAEERYHRYGGRGIKVCEKWHDFTSFFTDMGQRPSAKHSIDRLNNDGNYELGNCAWVTKRDQAINRSSSIIVEYNGEHIELARLAVIHAINVRVLRSRVQKLGWSLDRALHEPVVVGRNQYS